MRTTNNNNKNGFTKIELPNMNILEEKLFYHKNFSKKRLIVIALGAIYFMLLVLSFVYLF